MTDIQDRIRKLIAMAEHSGGNDNEMKNAMAMASEMMMKHGISRASLDSKPASIIEGTQFPMNYDWYIYAAEAMKHLFGVVTISYLHWDKSKTSAFIGRPDNVDAAQDTFAFVVMQVEMLYKQALPKGMTQKARAEYRKYFKVTCAKRVLQRCREVEAHQTSDDLTGAGGGTALAIIGHREQLANEVEEYMAREHPSIPTRIKKGPTGRVGITGLGAMFAGERAGDTVDLNRPEGRRRIG